MKRCIVRFVLPLLAMAFFPAPGAAQATLDVRGDWVMSSSSDGGNCNGTTISISQGPTGAVTSIEASVTCERGAATGRWTASNFKWVNANTLSWSYHYTSKSVDRLHDGTTQLNFSSGTVARETSRDAAGNEHWGEYRKKLTRDVQGDWVMSSSSDGGNCNGTTISIKQSADGSITSIDASVNCEKGAATGRWTGSNFRWVDANTLSWSYRFTSRSVDRLKDGATQIVFQSATVARETSRDAAGNEHWGEYRRK